MINLIFWKILQERDFFELSLYYENGSTQNLREYMGQKYKRNTLKVFFQKWLCIYSRKRQWGKPVQFANITSFWPRQRIEDLRLVKLARKVAKSYGEAVKVEKELMVTSDVY